MLKQWQNLNLLTGDIGSGKITRKRIVGKWAVGKAEREGVPGRRAVQPAACTSPHALRQKNGVYHWGVQAWAVQKAAGWTGQGRLAPTPTPQTQHPKPRVVGLGQVHSNRLRGISMLVKYSKGARNAQV